MTETSPRLSIILAEIALPVMVLAQVGNTGSPSVGVSVPAKIGIISVQNALIATSDGQKEFQALEKKFEPKKSELKSLNDEIDGLKKQLETQGPKLNDDARVNLARQIDSKQKSFSRAQDDAQSDYTEQQNEIVQKLLQKLLPVVDRYAKENGFTLVIDGSKPWPEWPVLWASPSLDITKAVVDTYNARSAEAPASVERGFRPEKAIPAPKAQNSKPPA
jgi:outer membrane protein